MILHSLHKHSAIMLHQSILMMHGNLLNEIERAENILAENARKLAKRNLSPRDVKQLQQERKKLEKYKQDLLDEWRQLNS